MSKMDIDDITYNSSLRVRVFSQLQNDILNGKYRYGENLIESRLCDELGVSRTPVREAIRQLELEGLVTSIPNKGAVVRGITSKDIEDICTIRMMIEGLASRWAAEKATQEEIKELQEALELEEFYTNKKGFDQLLKFDSRFHELIYKASKSNPLMQTLSSFHHYIQRARGASLSSPERAKEVLVEHRAILQAIMDKDADKAEKLTVEHVKNASLSFINQGKQKTELKTVR